MKKEVGSIFPLSNEALCEAEGKKASFSGNFIYYSLCREALYDIAMHLHSKDGDTVLIPAYTCQTVITPFEEAGWKCIFYPIQKNLRIDTYNLERLASQHHPSAIVVHPFFGMDLNHEEETFIQEIGSNNVRVILDLTQCLFSTKRYSFVDFTVASYRKWFPIPDGGYLKYESKMAISQPEMDHKEFTEREIAAMYLRGQYFATGEQRTKAISIQLSKSADHIAEHNITPHKMSDVAYNLLQKENIQDNQNQRFKNYTFLYSNICESKEVKKVCQNMDEVTTAPLYFTIYVQNRKALQHLLAQDAIYAPVIWPVENDRVLINDDLRYIYDHILAIPCDQRYNTEDMQRAVNIVNNY